MLENKDINPNFALVCLVLALVIFGFMFHPFLFPDLYPVSDSVSDTAVAVADESAQALIPLPSLEPRMTIEVSFVPGALIRAKNSYPLIKDIPVYEYGVTPISMETGEMVSDTLWVAIGPRGFNVGDVVVLKREAFCRFDTPTPTNNGIYVILRIATVYALDH